MTRSCLNTISVKETSKTAVLLPLTLVFIPRHNAHRGALLAGWLADLARERARGDAASAVKGFIAICVLVVIATALLVAI